MTSPTTKPSVMRWRDRPTESNAVCHITAGGAITPDHHMATSVPLYPTEFDNSVDLKPTPNEEMKLDRTAYTARALTCMAAIPALSSVCRWHDSLATARKDWRDLRKKPTSPKVPPGKIKQRQKSQTQAEAGTNQRTGWQTAIKPFTCFSRRSEANSCCMSGERRISR